jgi:hypothetical protein
MTVLYRSILQVLAPLRQTDIPFMVVKGPALAHALYPEPSLRTFSDLDLIVRERDWTKIHYWLVKRGFRSEDNLPVPPPKLVPQGVLYEQKYRHSETKLLVEVHYDDILNAGLASRDLEGFWRRAILVDIAGLPTPTLALEDQLIHLCAHMHYHGYVRLCWFSDLVFIVRDRATSLNWDRLLETVRQEAAQVPAYYSLYFLKQLLDVTVPAHVLAALQPDHFRRWLHERYLPENQVLSWQPMWHPDFSFYFTPLVKRLLPDMLVMGRRVDKLYYLFRLLFPSRAWLRYYYRLDAASGISIHYLLHPLKLAYHYLEEIGREITGWINLRLGSGRVQARQGASDALSDF